MKIDTPKADVQGKSMLRLLVLTITCLVGSVPTTASAGVISYTTSFGGLTLPFGPLTMNFRQYDGPPENLASILFTFQGNVGSTLRIENIGNDKARVTLIGGGRFQLDPPFPRALTFFGPALTQELEIFDGVQDFSGDSSWSEVSESFFTSSERLSNRLQFTPYLGTGTFDFKILANPSSSLVANNAKSISMVDTIAAGSMTLSYYTAPEPHTMILVSIGLFGLGTFNRRKI
ncbi:MAG: choice-of-anchor E domain-containing protein [Candidatus Accumulibacter sp.]|nr:choice-of-anchor E domain-containing protein [Accumulibacter sp.]